MAGRPSRYPYTVPAAQNDEDYDDQYTGNQDYEVYSPRMNEHPYRYWQRQPDVEVPANSLQFATQTDPFWSSETQPSTQYPPYMSTGSIDHTNADRSLEGDPTAYDRVQMTSTVTYDDNQNYEVDAVQESYGAPSEVDSGGESTAVEVGSWPTQDDRDYHFRRHADESIVLPPQVDHGCHQHKPKKKPKSHKKDHSKAAKDGLDSFVRSFDKEKAKDGHKSKRGSRG